MKTIGASIVVLARAVILSAAAFIKHSDTNTVLSLIGATVGVIGLVSFGRAFTRE